MADAAATGVSLWRTRIVWALLGAGATAVVTWPAEDGARQEQVVPTAVHAPPVPPADPGVRGSTGVAPADASTSGMASGMASSTTESPDSTVEPPDDAAGSTGIEASIPEVPLPRMPGSKQMRRVRRPDDEGDGWRIILALSVPAPGPQVEAFYRSALRAESMEVWGGGEAEGSLSDGYRGTLKARRRDAGVEITTSQRAGTLRSVVRIYWHARGEAQSAQ